MPGDYSALDVEDKAAKNLFVVHRRLCRSLVVERAEHVSSVRDRSVGGVSLDFLVFAGP